MPSRTVLVCAVITQPAEHAGVPPVSATPDARVPAETRPQPAAPPPPHAPLPPLPPPHDTSPQFARKVPYPIELVDRPLVLPGGATRRLPVLELTFRRWDSFIDGAVGLARHPDTFLNIGFSKRWGI